MIDFFLNANWILIVGVAGATALLVYEFYAGHKVDLEDPMPKWLRAHYRSKRR